VDDTNRKDCKLPNPERHGGEDGLERIIASIRRIQQDNGRLPSERQLADDLNVKRHQLRKALQSLREAGELQPRRAPRAIETLPGYGEELVQLTNPLEVLELRLIMEPGFARLASLRASSVDIERILEAATTPTGSPAGQADLAFHFAVLRAARNHLAEELYKTMRQVGFDSRMKIARAPSPTCPNRIAIRDAEHMRVAQAISQRDPEAAEAAMREHLHAVQDQLNQRSSTRAFAAA
jgi:GntR family transcriptional regulator, transcriptional repressor for pyruvate dehydrogenase complex